MFATWSVLLTSWRNYGGSNVFVALNEVKWASRIRGETHRLFGRPTPMMKSPRFWPSATRSSQLSSGTGDRFECRNRQAIYPRAAVKPRWVSNIRVRSGRSRPRPSARLGEHDPAADRRCIRPLTGLMFTTIARNDDFDRFADICLTLSKTALGDTNPPDGLESALAAASHFSPARLPFLDRLAAAAENPVRQPIAFQVYLDPERPANHRALRR